VGKRISKQNSMTYRTGYRGGAALFSLPFLGIGVFFALMGFEVIPVPGDSKVNAPLWVVGFVGLAFALAGLMLLGHGLRGMRHHARRKHIVQIHPNRPWLADYPWDETGIDSRLGARALQNLFGTTIWFVFLVPFHWWAFLSGEGPLMVQVIVGLFALISVFVLWKAVEGVLQWAKFGRCRLRFRTFPFEPGGKLAVQFSPNAFDRLKATLRFVEERVVQSGSGRNRSSRIVHEALYEDAQELEPGALNPEVDIEFELPDELVNDISGTPIRYWELKIEADVPGVDFEASFPIPVYAGTRKATAASGGTVMATD